MNGQREGSSEAAFRQTPSPSQPPMRSPSHSPSVPSQCYDLQTLESSFARLSVYDPNVRQQSPLLNTHWTNRYSPSLHNDRNWSIPPTNPHREINHRSYGYEATTTTTTTNHHILNGSYITRNRYLDQSPWDSYGFSDIDDNNGTTTATSIVTLAKDRIYYNELQKKINEGSKETIDMIFNDVMFGICDLMVDPFGHHVVEKLMEKCSSEQITQIIDFVTQQQYRFVSICSDPLGTLSIQALLRCLRSDDQVMNIVEAISVVGLALTKSNSGKHVILQCFNQFTPSQNRNLLEVIARNCYRIAIDQHGCCMLQQCLSIDCELLKQRLIHEIIANALKLCLNCYGNYVVQYVVELDDRRVTEELMRQLIGSYSYLSRDKYGSHAVQKFLKIKGIDSRFIVHDLLRDIDSLLIDPFGNYVIQTAWMVSKDDMRQVLMFSIRSNVHLMRFNKFGRKILEKLGL